MSLKVQAGPEWKSADVLHVPGHGGCEDPGNSGRPVALSLSAPPGLLPRPCCVAAPGARRDESAPVSGVSA